MFCSVGGRWLAVGWWLAVGRWLVGMVGSPCMHSFMDRVRVFVNLVVGLVWLVRRVRVLCWG